MSKLLLVSLGLVLTIGTTVWAQEPPKIRKEDLSRTALAAGELRITLTQLSNAPFFGPGLAEVDVKNAGTDATAFDPQRLSLVRPDSVQIDMLGVIVGADVQSSPRELLIIGGARSKQTYRLNGRLDFPLRVFYQGKLIGEVME